MPQEARVVPAARCCSSVISVLPISSKIFTTVFMFSSEAPMGTMNVIEAISAIAILGITRNRGGQFSPNHSLMLSDFTPAAITIRICFFGSSSGRISFNTRSTSQGFTTTQTMSAVSAANLLSVVTLTPIFENFSTTACEGSLTVMSSFLNCWPLMRPSTVAPPMAPAPIIDILLIIFNA